MEEFGALDVGEMDGQDLHQGGIRGLVCDWLVVFSLCKKTKHVIALDSSRQHGSPQVTGWQQVNEFGTLDVEGADGQDLHQEGIRGLACDVV